MVRQIKPMLAAEPKSKGKLDKAYIDARLNDPEWLAEEKFDGARYLAHFAPDRLYFTSRRESEVTGLQVEKGLNLPHLNIASPALEGTVLDGEVTIGKNSSNVTSIMGALPEKAIRRQMEGGWCRYRVWDILYYKGRDCRLDPLLFRKKLLAVAVEEWKEHTQFTADHIAELQAYFLKLKGAPNMDLSPEGLRKLMHDSIELVPYRFENKQAFLEEVWGRGGEGLVLKNMRSSYVDDSRDKESWIKIKQHLSFDVVIMGFTTPDEFSINTKGETITNRFFTAGWISAIRFGQYKDGELVEIGQTSGMTDAVRKELSENQDKYIGKVIEVKAQEQLESGALRHPRFIRFRDDKSPADCKLNTKV